MNEIELGSIVGVFGFGGEVRVHLHNRDESSLVEPRPVTLVAPDGERRAAVMSIRPGAGKRIIGRINGVSTEAEARALGGWTIEIAREHLPPPRADEFYVADLVGLPVETDDGTEVGRLVEVVAGPKDIWVVEGEDGEQRFVLAVPENIVTVDLAEGRIVVTSASLAEE